MAEFKYKGLLIGDSSIPGEGKVHGVIPSHCASALKLSKNRWIIFFASLDMRGHDAARSILYQLRIDAPDGRIIREGIVAKNQNDWDPFSRGDHFWKCNDNPVAFGCSKDAVYAGKVLLSANHFVVKWCTYAHIEKNNMLINSASFDWPGKKYVFNRTLRIEWAQFKLNDDENDIELIQPPQLMIRKNHNNNDFSGLGLGFSMNHSLVPPLPLDASMQDWIEYDTFTLENEGIGGHGRVAPVKYSFNRAMGLYEWTDTGALLSVPDSVIGESSLCRINDDFIASFRVFNKNQSIWLKTSDPFSKSMLLKKMTGHNTPRHIFLCEDNKIRLFCNNADLSPYQQRRNPLYACEISPDNFSHTRYAIVFDAVKENLPFKFPFIDLPKLFPAYDGKQILAFRAITRAQTVGYKSDYPSTPEEILKSGIHYVDILY